MKPARLSSGLLARKGGAVPLAGAYGGTSLEPLIGLIGHGVRHPARWPAMVEPSPPPAPAAPPSSRIAPRPAEPAASPSLNPIRLSLKVDPERHARLRILAARKGTRPQDLLREALDSVLLAANSDDCPCVRGELPCCGGGTCG
jgi:hypothetical protein